MSSSKSAAPLAIEIKPSRTLGAFLSCAHFGAAGIGAILPLPAWVVAALVASIGAHAVYTMRKHALLRADASIVRVSWDAHGQWTLTQRNGATVAAQLAADSYVHPLLTVLIFKTSRWRGGAVIIVPGRIDEDLFRRLRVRLMLARSSEE